MDIAILGAKLIGGTLGKSWAKAGHRVFFGVRHPDNPELKSLVESIGAAASAGTIADAIGRANIVVFAIPGAAMDETIAAHAGALKGKIVIDTTNKMGAPVSNSAATFAAQVPDAQVVRAFANMGFELFANPRFSDESADLFYAGPDGEARLQVEQLINDVGLRPIRVGGIDRAGIADSVGRLWVTLAYEQKMGRQVAFKVLSR
jgi:8-hydroxy-5-deazaflavin:NADPH oxidoreductase